MRTGLHSCKATRAGDSDYPGLSGGQRRRLSLAVALAKTPSLLIADEPTTGLDDAAAAAVIKVLCDIAKACGLAVVCTIHQPGAIVFGYMSSVLLLSKARTAYYGQASDMTAYANALGRPAPLGLSISEHMLNLINADFASDAEVEKVLDAWRKQRPPQPTHSTLRPLPPAPIRPPFLRGFRLLCEKMAITLLQDYGFVRNKLVSFLVLSTVYGIYTVGARDKEQEDINTLYYGSNFMAGNILFYQIASFNNYCDRWGPFQREIKNGMYGAALYWCVSSTLAALVALGVILNTVPQSLFMGLPGSSYFGIFVLCFAYLAFNDAFVETASLFGREVGTGLVGMCGIHGAFTNGVFQDPSSVIWPFRLFSYILPGRYVFEGSLQLFFGGENNHFQGAYRLSSAPDHIRHSPAGLLAASRNQTFFCPDSETCYGDNGREVLNALSVRAHPSR